MEGFLFVFVTSVFVLVFKKRIYPGGWYPAITSTMYTFTALQGFCKVIALPVRFRAIYADMEDDGDATWDTYVIVMAAGTTFHTNMYWFHMLTWIGIIHPKNSNGCNIKQTLKRGRHWFCIANGLVIGGLTICKVTFPGDYTLDTVMLAYHVFMGSSAVFLTLAYIIHWKKLLKLVTASHLPRNEKAHRTAKMSQVLLVFTICLDFAVVYALMKVLNHTPLNTQVPDIPFFYIFRLLPELIAALAVLYYFSPLKIYRFPKDEEASPAPSSNYIGMVDIVEGKETDNQKSKYELEKQSFPSTSSSSSSSSELETKQEEHNTTDISPTTSVDL